MTENQTTNSIAILQYNLQRSQPRTHSVLSDPASEKYTILALQEQYWSDFHKSSLIHKSWTLIEPKTTPDKIPRSVIYINNQKLSTSAFKIIELPFTNVTAITIKTMNTLKPTLIMNVYKPNDENLITPLSQYIQQNLNMTHYNVVIILGDFNLHHPLWNPPQYHEQDSQANELIDTMLDLGMQLLTPVGTITRPISGTAIDLVWGNEHALNNILKCQIATENDHGSDHLPIETVVDLQPHPTELPQAPYNFSKTEWKALKSKLQGYLPPLPRKESIRTAEAIDIFANNLTDAIAKAISETTPRKKPSPFSKR